MASRLSAFPQSHPFRSPLIKNPPDSVPSIDELEQLHSELRAAKQRVLERRRKASEDLKTIEESIRRMTEKEKGKSKAVDKVKRERDCTHLFPFVIGAILTIYSIPFQTYGALPCNSANLPQTNSSVSRQFHWVFFLSYGPILWNLNLTCFGPFLLICRRASSLVAHWKYCKRTLQTAFTTPCGNLYWIMSGSKKILGGVKRTLINLPKSSHSASRWWWEQRINFIPIRIFEIAEWYPPT